METATAFYIVLDKDRAVSSDDSEIEAWNAAEKNIKGINTVYNVEATKGKAEILIDSNVKDVYGFRVYAVNHDGSLVDPDGKAFYVLTGEAAEELNAYSVEKTWTANGKSEISMVPVADGVFGDWLNNVKTVDYVTSDVDTVAYGSETPVKAFTIKYATEEMVHNMSLLKIQKLTMLSSSLLPQLQVLKITGMMIPRLTLVHWNSKTLEIKF